MIQPKVIPCGWFPPKGYSAITLYKWIIVRKDYLEKVKNTDKWIKTLNHEKIHLAQIEELGVLKFYFLYIYYFLRLWIFTKRDWVAAYRDIPFEYEAYEFDQDLTYLSNREPFKWMQYKHF